MELWLIIIVTVCLCFSIRAVFNLLSPSSSSSSSPPLPPGPLRFPIIGNLLWLSRSLSELEPILRKLHAKYGPIITLPIGSRPAIFIADRSMAHQALIQNGLVFSDRPTSLATEQILNSDQHNIISSSYGPIWRLLRRNLASEMLHPARIRSFSGIRKWVLDLLLIRLKADSKCSDNNPIQVKDHIQYAVFCLLATLCFGEKLDDKQIRDIERVQRNILFSLRRFKMLNFWPAITRVVLCYKWKKFLQIKQEQKDVLIPLIRARKKLNEERFSQEQDDDDDEHNDEDDEHIVSYVDTLLDLEWHGEKRKLSEGEIVSICSEFINAGTDTTANALQWTLACLVKYPEIQQKLVDEIREVMNDREEDREVIREEDLGKMPYLKAVILEGLRRHPPAHFVLPHAVSKDMVFNNYLLPKNGSLNFMVAEMGWDPQVWEDPMEFRPERFLSTEKNDGEIFDITGSKEIKMMPFGVGRRMCPGHVLALLHLEYYVANLVWNFEWKACDDVDLSEKEEFTIVMKYPLQVRLCPRF